MNQKPNKRRAAFLKLLGTAIVLFAIFIQFHWSDSLRESVQTGKNSLSDMASARIALENARVQKIQASPDALSLEEAVRGYLWSLSD